MPEVVAYGPDPDQFLELTLPEGEGPAPVAVVLHGGFWRAAYDRRHLRHLAAALAGLGYRVALPEYRRVGDPGGGDPGTIDDARRILREVPALLGVDAGEVVLAGHSAGGHLAVVAAVAALLGDPDPDPARIAALDPMALALPACEIVAVHGRRDDVVPVAYSTAYAARDPRIRLDLPDGDHFDLVDPASPVFATVAAAL